jgi:hypothetical protein
VAQLIQARRLTPEGWIIGLQPKLTVGAADDQYEREADHVARQVVSMPDSAVLASSSQTSPIEGDNAAHTLQSKPLPLTASITPFMQRQIGAEEESEEDQDKEALLQAKLINKSVALPLQRRPTTEEEETETIQTKSAGSGGDSFEAGDHVESQINQSKGGGSRLPDSVRAYMEPRFGVDFSHVRVHTGSHAIQMSRDIGAQAFTHGSDIYYGAGSSPDNLELTAHELTHVMQQTGLLQMQQHEETVEGVSESRPEAMPESSSFEMDQDLLHQIDELFPPNISNDLGVTAHSQSSGGLIGELRSRFTGHAIQILHETPEQRSPQGISVFGATAEELRSISDTLELIPVSNYSTIPRIVVADVLTGRKTTGGASFTENQAQALSERSPWQRLAQETGWVQLARLELSRDSFIRARQRAERRDRRDQAQQRESPPNSGSIWDTLLHETGHFIEATYDIDRLVQLNNFPNICYRGTNRSSDCGAARERFADAYMQHFTSPFYERDPERRALGAVLDTVEQQYIIRQETTAEGQAEVTTPVPTIQRTLIKESLQEIGPFRDSGLLEIQPITRNTASTLRTRIERQSSAQDSLIHRQSLAYDEPYSTESRHIPIEFVPGETIEDSTGLEQATLEELFGLYTSRERIHQIPSTGNRYGNSWIYSSGGSGIIRQAIRSKLEREVSNTEVCFECTDLRMHIEESLGGPEFRRRELRLIIEDVFEAPNWRATLQIPINPTWSPQKRRYAELWNSKGRLFTDLAHNLDPGIPPYVAAGIMAAETGQEFFQNGRAVARFEAHTFWNRWGASHPQLFNQHFIRTRPHKWRREPRTPFQTYHGNQDNEWIVLDFARSLDSDANIKAVESTSFGAGQTMGSNYSSAGFSSPLEMLEHYQTRERAQVEGIFNYIAAISPSNRTVVINGIKQGNFLPLSQAYRPRDPAAHAQRITSAVNVMQALVNEASSEGGETP